MSLVVLTVIERDARFLLIEEAKEGVRGTWNLPGGRVEDGEGLVEAARREVEEEAGIAVELLGLMRVHLGTSFLNPTQTVVRFAFVGKPREPGLLTLKSQSDEHSLRAAWFTLEELRQLPLRGPHVLETFELAARKPPLLPLSSLKSDFGALAPKR